MHQDIYKRASDLPPLIQKLSRRLADQLAVLDDIAEDIREELSKHVEPSVGFEDTDPLTKESVAMIYYELFGEKPLEYILQFALNKLLETGLATLGELKKYLPSKEVRAKLDALYRKFFGGWSIDKTDMLVWGVRVMMSGSKIYREFVQMTKDEWQEIERIGHREALSELPNTIEELIDDLQDQNISWGFFIALRELNGLKNCQNCGVEIFDADTAHQVLCDHYGVDCPELIDVLYPICDSGLVEPEDAEHSGLCPHCAHLIYSDNT